METVVWTDGSCNVDGVAGRGGWAALIERDGSTEQFVGSAPGTTQNRMELTAVCEALDRVTGAIEVQTDSTYIAKCFSEGWHIRWRRDDKWRTTKGPVKNRDLWERLFALVEDDARDVSFVWHKRGEANNKIVDHLSREASKSHPASEPGYQPEQVVTTANEILATLGKPMESQVKKVIDHIDDHCRAWIERSPFVVISTASAAGAVDVSPRGDPAGFVRVLDPKTLAVPDRPGNHRGDTFLNVLDNPNVGLMFVVPKRREVVRVSGTALIVKDGSLLESMAVGGKVPSLALVVHVHEAMFHCGKSMIRSHMWEPDLWGAVDGLPTYGRALVDHGQLDRSVEDMEQATDLNEKNRLYDE